MLVARAWTTITKHGAPAAAVVVRSSRCSGGGGMSTGVKRGVCRAWWQRVGLTVAAQHRRGYGRGHRDGVSTATAAPVSRGGQQRWRRCPAVRGRWGGVRHDGKMDLTPWRVKLIAKPIMAVMVASNPQRPHRRVLTSVWTEGQGARGSVARLGARGKWVRGNLCP
jgi:hypothetical protein